MTIVYQVDGMTCEGCATAVANAIRAAVPGCTVAVDLPAGRVSVRGADAGSVKGAVEGAGFTYGGVVLRA